MRNHGDRLDRMRATLRKEARILEQLASVLDDRVNSPVDLLLETKGHVLVAGSGTSNPVALRFAHLLSCCGLPALFIHPADSLHGGSGAIKPEDTLVLISKGGRTAEINRLARIARKRGARVVAVTEAPESELGQLADDIIRVKVAADSDPFGLVATSSSLANAAVLDAVCETVLVEKGYSLQSFAETHPGGAVGTKIEEKGLGNRDEREE
ncbi:MAG TPA: SIS domain-containing protein [Terriglobia bacterium]|nr:SIS domain-containing protein [Terriglobia bacterium]